MSRVNDDEVLHGRPGRSRDCDGCAGLAPWLGLVSVGDPVPEELNLVG